MEYVGVFPIRQCCGLNKCGERDGLRPVCLQCVGIFRMRIIAQGEKRVYFMSILFETEQDHHQK